MASRRLYDLLIDAFTSMALEFMIKAWQLVVVLFFELYSGWRIGGVALNIHYRKK